MDPFASPPQVPQQEAVAPGAPKKIKPIHSPTVRQQLFPPNQ